MDGNEDPSVTVIRDDVRSDTQKIGLAIVVVHEVNGNLWIMNRFWQITGGFPLKIVRIAKGSLG